MSIETRQAPPTGGSTGDDDCTSKEGAQQLLCLLHNPYASSVSFSTVGAVGMVAETSLRLVQRNRHIRCFRILRGCDDPDNRSIFTHETSQYDCIRPQNQIRR